MAGYLLTVGPTEAQGMGVGPVSFLSVQSWAQMTGTALTPWQVETLRAMSSAYAGAVDEFRGKKAAPPHGLDPSSTAKAIKGAIRGVARPRRHMPR